jgi:hypothetical protein
MAEQKAYGVAETQQVMVNQPQFCDAELGQSVAVEPQTVHFRSAAHRARIESFLACVRRSPNLTKAAEACKQDVSTHNKWLVNVPGYPEEFDKAWKIGLQSFEAEVIRRAQDGFEEPVFQQGALVGHKRVYSDRLAEVVLKGNIARYKDQAPAAGGISIHLAVGITAGQPAAPPAAVVQAIEVQALPAAADPDDEFGIALLPSSTPSSTLDPK